MLVLTRKIDQKIRIGNNIVITIVKIQKDQISIGIEAPRDVLIIREELLAQELEKNAKSVNRESAIEKNKEFSEMSAKLKLLAEALQEKENDAEHD